MENIDATILKSTIVTVYDRALKPIKATLAVTDEPFNRLYLSVNDYPTINAPDGITLSRKLYEQTGLILKDNIILADRAHGVIITTESEKTGHFELSPRTRNGRSAALIPTRTRPIRNQPKVSKKSKRLARKVVSKVFNRNFPKWGSYER